MTYRIAVFAALRHPEASLPRRSDVPRRQQQVTVPHARAASTACGGVPQEAREDEQRRLALIASVDFFVVQTFGS